MTSLIRTTLLGSQFIADPNFKEWMKIDRVVMGETSKFGYRSGQNKDIGSLLRQLLNDPVVVVCLYNWSTGNYYLKSGFDMNSSTDSAVNASYTTFIVIPRVQSSFLKTVAPSASIPTPTTSKFVKWNASLRQFTIDNKKWSLLGANCYWLGLHETGEYPLKAQITEMFTITNKMAGTVIRSHTLGISSGKPNSLRPYNNNLNDLAWDSIDFALSQAKATGIKVIPVLLDEWYWYNGNYGDFCNTRGVDKSAFWTNLDVRNDFKDFLFKWLNHINKYTGVANKNCPEIAILELGNELGNSSVRISQDNISIPPKEWTTDITKYIKSIDQNHLVLCGSDECLGNKISDDFSVPQLDVYSAHFYWNDTNRLDFGSKKAYSLGKPYIIGEYDSGFGQDWYNQIASRPEVSGLIMWGLYPSIDGNLNSPPLIHNDGSTINWGDPKLLLISNNFRKIQGLPTVWSL